MGFPSDSICVGSSMGPSRVVRPREPNSAADDRTGVNGNGTLATPADQDDIAVTMSPPVVNNRRSSRCIGRWYP
jgi:hypothetical protein